jgi:hypothetical protein
MQPAFQFDDHTIFVKSTKGRDEISGRNEGLNARERRALILVDGVRDLLALARILPKPELEEALASLIGKGLIEKSGDMAMPSSAEAVMPPRRPEDEETIRQVKDFMIVTAQTYLGLLGGEVIRRVELASDAQALLAAAGHWHVALHGSRQGKRFAAPYLEQVKTALASSGT